MARTARKRSSINKAVFFSFLSSLLVKESFSHFFFFPPWFAGLFVIFFSLCWCCQIFASFPSEKWLGGFTRSAQMAFGSSAFFWAGLNHICPFTHSYRHVDVIRALLNIDHSAHLRNRYMKARLPMIRFMPLWIPSALRRLSDLPLLLQSETYFGKKSFLITPWTRLVKTQPAGFNWPLSAVKTSWVQPIRCPQSGRLESLWRDDGALMWVNTQNLLMFPWLIISNVSIHFILFEFYDFA